MSEVKPVHKEVTVAKDVAELHAALLDKVKMLNGRVVSSENNTIVCDFGSLLLSRLVGEFWVPKSTLPKQAAIQLQAAGVGGTTLVLDIKDTHKYGYMLGYVQKYEQALQELSESLLSAVK